MASVIPGDIRRENDLNARTAGSKTNHQVKSDGNVQIRTNSTSKPKGGFTRMLRRLVRFLMFSTVCFIAVGMMIHRNPAYFFDGRGGCRQIDAPKEFHFPKDSCIAIIGASSGIGKEMADVLSYETDTRVRLILTGRTEESAKRVAPHDRLLLAHHLDLEEHESVDQFSHDLRRVVGKSCLHGRLDYLFLNAGMMYAPRYDESFISKDGQFDRLFSVNFHGYTRLIKRLVPDVLHPSTRVIYVSTVAHYQGVINDVFEPDLTPKETLVSTMRAFSSSKLALSAMQQILAMDGRAPNSVLVTPGSTDTPLFIEPKKRHRGGESPYPFWVKQFEFTARQGAEFVLQAALLPQDSVKPGEIVQPFFFPFAESWHVKYSPFYSVKIVMNILAELVFQKMTHTKNKLWICPASKESRADAFHQRLKETYLS